MKILKYLLTFLVLYFIGNVAFWSYQEYTYSDDMQNIENMGNTIDIARVSIQEKEQALDIKKKALIEQKEILDKLYADKKFAQYNELVLDYNQVVNDVNNTIQEYEQIIEVHNQNVDMVNELIIKSATRYYLFPFKSYTPELYKKFQ